MVGKAQLILVIGFTLIFVIMGYLWESVSTRSVENHVSYHNLTIARNIAVSGANIALSEFTRDSNWVSDITDRPFDGGTMTVNIVGTSLDSIRTLTSVGKYMVGTSDEVEQSVVVKLKRGTRIFEEYAWFIPSVSTGSINRPWITGDTVWGAFHTNQFLVVDGNPVFTGKVSTLKGIQDQAKKPNVSDPQFLGGYESPVNVTWDPNMTFPDYALLAQQGEAAGGSCNFDSKSVWLTFNADATVTYRVSTSGKQDDSSNYSAPITLPLTTMAPTGVIYVNRGNVYLSGVVDGEVTVVAEGSAGGNLQSGQGNVGFVGDITYKVDPMIPNGAGGFKPNPACDDLLGVIATNSAIVSTATTSGGYQNNVLDPDFHVDAGIFCVKGGFPVLMVLIRYPLPAVFISKVQ